MTLLLNPVQPTEVLKGVNEIKTLYVSYGKSRLLMRFLLSAMVYYDRVFSWFKLISLF